MIFKTGYRVPETKKATALCRSLFGIVCEIVSLFLFTLAFVAYFFGKCVACIVPVFSLENVFV